VQTSGNVGGDPLFIDLGNLIFTFRAASPARDAGVAALPNNPFVVGNKSRVGQRRRGASARKAFEPGAYEAPRLKLRIAK